MPALPPQFQQERSRPPHPDLRRNQQQTQISVAEIPAENRSIRAEEPQVSPTRKQLDDYSCKFTALAHSQAGHYTGETGTAV
jgi:hypothetical protein